MNTSEANPAMQAEKHCPQCNAPLPAGVLAGLCPACLLKQGAAADTAPAPGAAPFTPPSVAELAKLFPQLEIHSLIGVGGMGAVYRARQLALDRFVALKILPPQAAGGADFAERFNREARALAKLSHPNIVAVYDFGSVSSPPLRGGTETTNRHGVAGYEVAGVLHYFIMEFVDGANLRQLIRSGRLAPREALAIVPQICDALQFAHDEGVVHRDIKPENILVDRRGRVKITDFGLARILGIEAGAARLTREGQVMGTPHYMAPEQVEHPQTVDHRADIYSLGVVFYEMLTGELPLGKFPAPSQKVQVDVRLDEVVLHALEKEPERRYQQASQVKTDVETIATTAPPKGGTPTVGVPASAGFANALQQVKGPAIGVLVTGILNWFVIPPLVLLVVYRIAAYSGQSVLSVSVPLGIPISALVLASLMIFGALKMKRLEGYGWAVASSILAIIITPGNLIGLPLGIWALVVLSRPEVRVAFGQQRAARGKPPAGNGAVAPDFLTPVELERARWIIFARAVIMCIAAAIFAIHLPATFGIPTVIWGLVGVWFVATKTLVARKTAEEDRAAVRLAGQVGLVHAIGVLAAGLALALNNTGLSEAWNLFFAALFGFGIVVCWLRLVGGRRVADWFARRWRTILLRDVPVAVVIALLLRVFVIETYHAEGNAVSPEIPRGSLIFVYKLARSFGSGDVVAYRRDGKVLAGRVAEAGPREGVVRVQRRQESPESVAAADIIGKVVFNTRAATPASRTPAAGIEHVRVSADKAVIEGRSAVNTKLVCCIPGQGGLLNTLLDNARFTATVARTPSGGLGCTVKAGRWYWMSLHSSTGTSQFGQTSLRQGWIVFREGTPSPEPDGSYVIGEFRPQTGAPLPITARLESQRHSAVTDMTQDVVKDIQPDGTIRFKTTITQRNTADEPLQTIRFSNSDFVHVDKLTDARRRTIPFSFTRTGKITLRYEATLVEPVKPGAEFSYVMEGTETGLVKRLPQSDVFEYTMRHWPGSSRTRRIERHLLPAGAQLQGKEPADLAERARDGCVELFIDRLIPSGDSLEVRYSYRLPTKP